MGIGELRGGKMGANGKMQYNPGWESGSKNSLVPIAAITALVETAEIIPNITPSIGELRGGKMGANGKMQYNPGWESGSMKTLAAHGLAGGIVQDRMGG
jgi:hypothetical protein